MSLYDQVRIQDFSSCVCVCGGGTGVWLDEWVHTSIDLCSFSVWRDPAFDKFRGGAGPPVPPPLNPPLGVVVKYFSWGCQGRKLH